ncbi:hypothetical protein F4776DRAFT_662188 [Hypoxylon sp. NC0597]|nr:hypothetical protein F4776DRAFT_662188 [Hypoxylon sp. NC0597]
MAHAVTPGRNRVEAAEIFGSPIEGVSDEVHLVMRMRRVGETLVWFALRDGNDCRCGTIRL